MNHDFALYGNIGKNIFEPSNGGNGIKLNTPSPIFIDIVLDINSIITIPTVDVIKVIPANLQSASLTAQNERYLQQIQAGNMSLQQFMSNQVK